MKLKMYINDQLIPNITKKIDLPIQTSNLLQV